MTASGPFSGDATVVKLHVFAFSRPVPATFVAPVEIVAVNVMFGPSGLVGVKVAVVPVYVTAAGTAVAPFLSTNVVPFNVEAVMASLKVAVMGAFRGTSLAAFTGTVDMTVGATSPFVFVGVSLHAARKNAQASMIFDRFTSSPGIWMTAGRR